MKDINATILIDLKNKTEEEIYKNFEYSRRKNIQKALRNGISYEENKNKDVLRECYEINSKVLKDGGTMPKKFEEWLEFISPDKNPFFIIKHKGDLIGCFSIKEIS